MLATQRINTAQLLRLCYYLLVACVPLLALFATPTRAQVNGPIYRIEIADVVSSHAVNYMRRAVREAEAANAEALIIRLAPQGAVLREVRQFAAEIADARIPIVVYVGPAGAQSGAAGAWLISAAHVAAMAPDTRFGAALPLAEPNPQLTEQTQELFLTEVITQLSDWNADRGRSADWVEQAVREGAVLTNTQAAALNPPAVEIVARDDADLLTLLEGRVVTLQNGDERTLRTLGQPTELLAPSLWEQILLLLANPTIAFLLLVMAGIALYAELVTPTFGMLAAIGGVLFLGSLVGFIALPVRWISVLGLLVAFGFIAADLYVASHGATTVIGLGIFVLSALTLFDTAQAPGVAVALWAVVLVVVLLAGLAAGGIYLALRTRNRPVTTGQEGLIGRLAQVRKRLEPEGMVFVEGALWRAVSEDGDVDVGDYVRVTGVYELRLTVRRVLAEEA
jgi:membrane-bound serine protease (ClpP class)